MNDNIENNYSTKDVYLAATLIALGNTWYSLDREDKVYYFVFDKNQEGQEDIEEDEE